MDAQQGLKTLLTRGRVLPSALVASRTNGAERFDCQRTIFRDQSTGAEVWRLTAFPCGVVRHIYSSWPAWNANGRLIHVQFSPSGASGLVDQETGVLYKGLDGGAWSPAEPNTIYRVAPWLGTRAVVAYDIAQNKVLRALGPAGESTTAMGVTDDGAWVCWAIGSQDEAMVWAVAKSDGSSCRFCSAAGGLLSERSPVTFEPPPRQPPISAVRKDAVSGGMHSMHFTRQPDNSVTMSFNMRLKNGGWHSEERVYTPDGKLKYIQKRRTGHVVFPPDGSFMFGETPDGYQKYDPFADRYFDPLKLADVYEGHVSWTGYDPRWIAASWHTKYAAEIARLSMKPDDSLIRLCGVCPQAPEAGTYNNLAFACQSPDATKVLFMSSMSGSVNEYLVVAANPRPPKLAGEWTREGFQLSITPNALSREVRRYRVYRAGHRGEAFREIGQVERTSDAPVLPLRTETYLIKETKRRDGALFVVRAEEWSGLASRFSNEIAADGKPVTECIEAEAMPFKGFKEGFEPQGAGDMDYLVVPASGLDCELSFTNSVNESDLWARVRGTNVSFAASSDSARADRFEQKASRFESWTWVRLGRLAGTVTISSRSPGFQIDRMLITPDHREKPQGTGPDYAVDRVFADAVPEHVQAAALSPFATEVKWQEVPGARYYNVYGSDNPDFVPAQASLLYSPPVGTERVVDWGLRPATTYFYIVLAVDREGAISRAGAAAKVTTASVATETVEIEFENGQGGAVTADASAHGAKSILLEKGKSWNVKFSTRAEGDFAFWQSFRCDHGSYMRLQVRIDDAAFRTTDLQYDKAMLYGKIIASDWLWWRWVSAESKPRDGVVHLKPGEHMLSLTPDQSIRLDRLMITSDLSLVPQGKLSSQ